MINARTVNLSHGARPMGLAKPVPISNMALTTLLGTARMLYQHTHLR